MTKHHRIHLLLPLALAAALSLSACSSSSGSDGQVASIATAGSSGTAKAKTASGDVEKELNDYTECLRKQGVNVPDIAVDADGNPSFGAGAANGAEKIDQDALAAAQKVCGDAPASLMSARQDRMNNPEFQDAALKFSQCMRAEGITVKDPDFSPSGSAGGSPFGDLDRDDPKTAAALEVCQKEFAAVTGSGN
jgi:hypothetical protein